jgi:hypothetical protein
MIVAMHVAGGAALGSIVGSRHAAALGGFALHGLQDAIPHEDIGSYRLETATGLALLGVLAWRRGPLDAAVIGGAACASPDLEHVVPLPRPGGRGLYPSHRIEGWHRGGGLPAWLQLAVAATIVTALIRRQKEP